MNINLGKIKHSIIHFIGNKARGEGVKFSQIETSLNEVENDFRKLVNDTFTFNEMHCFDFISELDLNPVYKFVTDIFDNTDKFIKQSHNITRYLYEQSVHTKIKNGEFYIVYYKDCNVKKETVDAIGLFKTENKNTYLQITPSENGFEVKKESGINKLDKGCLIFNYEKEKGYVVAVVDNTNKGEEAKYWVDNFLHIIPRKDDFFYTQSLLNLCKEFVSKELSDENDISKAEKAVILNKSVDILKEEPVVNIKKFAADVFQSPDIINKFNSYKSRYEEERNLNIEDSFEVSKKALKRKGFGTMTTVKLDNNFDINIHKGKEYLEKGFDKEKNMHYYKLYFIEEK